MRVAITGATGFIGKAVLKKIISDSPQHEILHLGSKVKDTNIKHLVFLSGCLGAKSRSLAILPSDKFKNSELINTIAKSVFELFSLMIKKSLINFYQIFPYKKSNEKR